MLEVLQKVTSRVRHLAEPAPPPKAPAEPSEAELWLDAVKATKRLALSLPIMAFVALILPAQFNAEVSLGSAKLKPIAGHRELAVLAMALLIVKLARDANRLTSFRRIASLDLDLSAKTGFDSFIKKDYARPLDLIRKREPTLRSNILAPLDCLEAIRRTLIFSIVSFASIFTITAIVTILKDMVLAPTLALPLSYGLAALALGLLVVAGIDLAGIGLLPLIIRRNERQVQAEAERAKADAEAEKRKPRHGLDWCKREADRVGETLPEPWPPADPDLRAFEDRIHARRLEKNEVWDPEGQCWRDRWAEQPIRRRRRV